MYRGALNSKRRNQESPFIASGKAMKLVQQQSKYKEGMHIKSRQKPAIDIIMHQMKSESTTSNHPESRSYHIEKPENFNSIFCEN